MEHLIYFTYFLAKYLNKYIKNNRYAQFPMNIYTTTIFKLIFHLILEYKKKNKAENETWRRCIGNWQIKTNPSNMSNRVLAIKMIIFIPFKQKEEDVAWHYLLRTGWCALPLGSNFWVNSRQVTCLWNISPSFESLSIHSILMWSHIYILELITSISIFMHHVQTFLSNFKLLSSI